MKYLFTVLFFTQEISEKYRAEAMDMIESVRFVNTPMIKGNE